MIEAYQESQGTLLYPVLRKDFVAMKLPLTVTVKCFMNVSSAWKPSLLSCFLLCQTPRGDLSGSKFEPEGLLFFRVSSKF